MRTCEIENCKEKHYAKGLCNKHYQRKYSKERYAIDLQYRKKIYEYQKKHFTIPKTRQHRIKYYKTHNTRQVPDFFKFYNRNENWQREGLEKMSEIYATISCGLSGKKACELQERIMIQAKDRIVKK